MMPSTSRSGDESLVRLKSCIDPIYTRGFEGKRAGAGVDVSGRGDVGLRLGERGRGS